MPVQSVAVSDRLKCRYGDRIAAPPLVEPAAELSGEKSDGSRH